MQASKRFGLLPCLLLLLVGGTAIAAGTYTFDDAIGDAFYTAGLQAPGFLDIDAASFTVSNDSLEFTGVIAGSLDDLPKPPNAGGAYFWGFLMDSDPASSPPGFPSDPAAMLPPEFLAYVLWDGVRFKAFLLDRRPALTGGPSVSWPLPVDVDGQLLIITVPPNLAALVQARRGARWRMNTGWWNTPDRQADALHFADTTDWLPWPK